MPFANEKLTIVTELDEDLNFVFIDFEAYIFNNELTLASEFGALRC